MQCPRCKYEPTMSEMQESPNTCLKCGTKYVGIGKVEQSPVVRGVGRNGVVRFSLLFFIVIFFVVAGYYGHSIYEDMRVAEQVDKEVKLTSAYVSQVLTALDGAGSMTFAEFFSKANKAVEEIDSIALRISVIEPQNQTTEAGISYTKKAQEVVRGTSSSMRALMSLSSARDREASAKVRTESSNEYIREAGYESLKGALDDQVKALDEIKEARSALALSAKGLRSAGEEMQGVGSSSLVSPPLLDKLVKFNE